MLATIWGHDRGQCPLIPIGRYGRAKLLNPSRNRAVLHCLGAVWGWCGEAAPGTGGEWQRERLKLVNRFAGLAAARSDRGRHMLDSDGIADRRIAHVFGASSSGPIFCVRCVVGAVAGPSG